MIHEYAVERIVIRFLMQLDERLAIITRDVEIIKGHVLPLYLSRGFYKVVGVLNRLVMKQSLRPIANSSLSSTRKLEPLYDVSFVDATYPPSNCVADLLADNILLEMAMYYLQFRFDQ